MLIVTHDMRMAADVSNHVVFLHDGRIVEEGPPDTLFGNPPIRAANCSFLSHSPTLV